VNGDPHRFNMGGVPCCTHTIAQLVAELRTLLRDKTLRPRTVLCVNAHIYNRATADPTLKQNLEAARVVAADGMAVVWAARLFGVRIPERCNMTESFRAFLTEPDMPANRAILIGCSPAEAEAAAAEIHRSSRHCRVLGAFSGFLDDAAYRAICEQHRAVDLILLGMGTPRTEFVAAQAAAICPEAIVWGIGGGTVRILAGTMEEAPIAWRRLGLQWLHRLLREPHRLWRRNLIGHPLFAFLILKAAFASRRRTQGNKSAPGELL
jgi:N-acetylglucosaminyldiphosphoundecaprenol N-acetyl-beta-D-mannosaminyltransferase